MQKIMCVAQHINHWNFRCTSRQYASVWCKEQSSLPRSNRTREDHLERQRSPVSEIGPLRFQSHESDGHLTVLEVLTNNYFHKQLFCQLFFQLIDESQFKRKKIRPKFPSLNCTITEHNFRLTVKKKKHKYSVTGSVCNVQY